MNNENNEDPKHKNFRDKVEKYIDQNGVTILKAMFPDHTNQKEQTEEKQSKPNNNEYLDLDSPIKKRIKTDEYLIEIYNWPAFFRVENGLITLFNECKVIFKIFFEKNKQYKEEEQKKRFFLFFKSIINEEHEIIKEFTEINYEADKIYSIKRGIEKLIDYFDLKSVENYFLVNNIIHIPKKVGYTIAGVIGAASLLAFSGFCYGILSSLAWPVGGGIGLFVCIGLVIYFTARKSSQKKEDDEFNKLNEMAKPIKEFFDSLHFFENKESDLTMNINNIFIIAIDKTKGNYGDSIIFHRNLKRLDSIRFPKDFDGNDSINMKYYKAYLKAFGYYNKKFKKYEEKYKSGTYEEKINLISKEILEDFKKLKDAKNHMEIDNLIEEEKKKEKERKKKKLKNYLFLFPIKKLWKEILVAVLIL